MREWFILGAAGFIGDALTRSLLARADTRVVLGTRASSDPLDALARSAPERVELATYGELEHLDLDRLARADVVVDLASPGRGRFASGFDLHSRIHGHVRLVDGLARREWPGRFVFLSSGGTIYGEGFLYPMQEDWPPHPAGEYGLEKAVVELHLDTLRRGRALDSTVLRISNAFGPRQPLRPGFGVIPAIAQALRDGEPFRRYGTGRSVRDYVYIDDVVEAVMRGAEVGAAGVFNIGSGVPTSVNDLLEMTEALTGRPVPVAPVSMPPGEPRAIVLDCARAANVLGWRASVGVREGLRRTLAHHGLVEADSAAGVA